MATTKRPQTLLQRSNVRDILESPQGPKEHILHLLAGGKSMTAGMIWGKMPTLNQRTVQRHLAELVLMRRIKRIKCPCGQGNIYSKV